MSDIGVGGSNSDNKMKPIPKKRGRPESEGKKTERFTMRLHEGQLDDLEYWADKFGASKSEFLTDAMYHYIAWVKSDYDLPTAEIVRLNQLIDAMESLVVSNRNLEGTVINGFDSLIGLTKGDNYLIEDESGEI